MKVIEFVNSYSPYFKGDIAGFEDRVANDIIKAGFAIPYNKAKKDALNKRNVLKDNSKDRQMKSDDDGVVTKA